LLAYVATLRRTRATNSHIASRSGSRTPPAPPIFGRYNRLAQTRVTFALATVRDTFTPPAAPPCF